MLALVAVDEHRKIGRLEHEGENFFDRLSWGKDFRVLVGENRDMMVRYAIAGDEIGICEGKVLGDEGDDSLEFEVGETVEVCVLRIRGAEEAWGNDAEVFWITCAFRRRRL